MHSKNSKRKIRVNKKRLTGFTAAAAGAVIALAVCFCLLAPVFKVDNIVCSGNSKVQSQTIIDVSGISAGKNIFLTSLRGKNRSVEALDYIEECKIKRVLPNTIKIFVTECRPSAYFSSGSDLVVTDPDGIVLETVSDSADTEEIINSKISEPEVTAEPTATEDPSTADGTIWGYDDDGDPIYRINGGHYEFDEDGNRFFVDDTNPTADPEQTEEPTEESSDGIERTSAGTVIYSAPIVYGVDVTKNKDGAAIESSDASKLESVLSALRSLEKAELLERTTKFDAEDPANIKFWIEDRLEVWFGGFGDFEYKAKFTAAVINNNLSPYERAIVDFRDSKLYVRSSDYVTPILIEDPDATSSPDPNATPAPSADADASPAPSGAETTTPSPSSSPAATPTATPTATPKATPTATDDSDA